MKFITVIALALFATVAFAQEETETNAAEGAPAIEEAATEAPAPAPTAHKKAAKAAKKTAKAAHKKAHHGNKKTE